MLHRPRVWPMLPLLIAVAQRPAQTQAFLLPPHVVAGTPVTTRSWAVRDAAGVGEQYVALPDLIGRGRLEDALERRGILGKEIPCMAFQSTGAPIAKLLTAEEWLFIIVTSPQSASILVRAWHDAGNPDIPVACVGAETRAILRQGGLFPLDVPIRRQTQPGDGAGGGKELIAALPTIQGDPGVQRILLPVSVKARDDMQRMLEARGFAVHRVDAYDSASVPWNHEQTALAVSAPVVALASPTAIQIWAERVGTSTKVACLGAKSEATCRAMGFDDLFVGGGGMEGWAKAVELALGSVQEK